MCTRCDGIGVHQDSGCRVDAPHVIRTHKLRVFVSGEMVIDLLAKNGFRVNFLGGDFELEAPNEALTSEEVALAIRTMEENVLEGACDGNFDYIWCAHESVNRGNS